VVLTAEEARKKGFRVNRRRKPNGIGVPNRPKCIWKVNRKNALQKTKEKLAARLGIKKKKEERVAFEEDDDAEFEEDDDDDSDALDEEDDHPNPFIL